MIKKHSFICVAIFGFLMCVMMALTILLYSEYRFFCCQATELLLLKQQYIRYVDTLRKKINDDSDNCQITRVSENENEEITPINQETIEEFTEESSIIIDEIIAAEGSDLADNDDEYVDDSFVVINRHPDYLKQSTFDYIESQELNALMTAIDIDRWSDYTDSFTDQTPSTDAMIINRKSTMPLSKTTNKQKNTRNVIISGRPIKEYGFIWPIDVNKFWLSSLFGPRKRIDGTWGFHHGIDMAAEKGRAVKAVREGIVQEASFQAGYGNTIVIEHINNLKTRYAHLHVIRVSVGQKVKQGNIIGTVGETGFIRKKGKDGSHLHFEVYEQGKRINPLHCLPRVT